jgi:glycosyltransferase involved in cell wall biosynthesis
MHTAAGHTRFSICIRACSRADGLRRAIESAAAQEVGGALEILVSDDSRGGHLEGVVEAIGDPRVVYTRNPDPAGSIANLRRVSAMASGDYVLVLDDDDELLPGFLETAAAPMDADPSVGLVFTGVLRDAGGHRRAYALPVPPGAVTNPLHMILAGYQPNRSATLLRRTALEQGERDHPLLDGHVGDLTTWIRTAAAGWGYHAVPDPLAIVALHSGQLSAREDHARLIRTLARFEFDDPHSDELRRTRLADARRCHAFTLAQRGRIPSARRELTEATAIAPHGTGESWFALMALSLTVGRPRLQQFTARHPRLGGALRTLRNRRRLEMAR